MNETQNEMSLIKDDIKIEWVDLEEGVDGDYDGDDPEDEKLLRFDVSVRINGEWEEKDDASYCTNFPASATEEQKRKGLVLLMDEYGDALSGDKTISVKKLGEHMSWISLDWIEE